MAGQFITFEGGEGSGKTTQAKMLADALERVGVETILTREPGGTFGAESIRKLVLEGTDDRWSGMTELLLMYAARLDHVEKLIKPALERGAWVISDRFSDSSLAYQGYARDLGADRVRAVHDVVMEGFNPDLTLVFDMDVYLSLKRVETRAAQDDEVLTRFDKAGQEFHTTIREAFLDIAKKEPSRVKVVDADGSRSAVHARILNALTAQYPEFAGKLGGA
ncbi:thymidylate kinase [Algimonas ampicilliniresistens]|jgi:dTMP kinase|uniref:Thymidylate kinase n=1 Tax=Algimonas ampicilliniresistens TaxID=1298735 RepID=A0ABQ5V719_9PROT|nr:dTMP kinase [Algimonas ampicilliniresistens]GLQ23336.1 thymidylate kinase [Algimonas ampicilliniresistens]